MRILFFMCYFIITTLVNAQPNLNQRPLVIETSKTKEGLFVPFSGLDNSVNCYITIKSSDGAIIESEKLLNNYQINIVDDKVFNYSYIINESVKALPNETRLILEFRNNGTIPLQLKMSSANVLQAYNQYFELKQWGDIIWSSNLSYLFAGVKNLRITATDIPNFSTVRDLSYAFANTNIVSIPNFSSLDFSGITNMEGMFLEATSFNQPLSNLDTSNVTNMRNMFKGAISFNQDVSHFNTSKVIDMSGMFENTPQFNQDVFDWDFSLVTNFSNFLDEKNTNDIICKKLNLAADNLYYNYTNENGICARAPMIQRNGVDENTIPSFISTIRTPTLSSYKTIEVSKNIAKQFNKSSFVFVGIYFGLKLPNSALSSNITQPVEGLIYYDTGSSCIKMFKENEQGVLVANCIQPSNNY